MNSLVTVESNSFIDDLLPLVQQHARLEQANAAQENLVVTQYTSAAIAAAENYLDRDVFPRTYTFGNIITPFYFRRGAARTISFFDSANQPIDDPSNINMMVGTGVKGWGFAFGSYTRNCGCYCGRFCAYPASEVVGGKVQVASGYTDVADFPPDLTQFILATFGMLYEVRETANYSNVFHAEPLPYYLLDSWRTLPVA